MPRVGDDATSDRDVELGGLPWPEWAVEVDAREERPHPQELRGAAADRANAFGFEGRALPEPVVEVVA